MISRFFTTTFTRKGLTYTNNKGTYGVLDTFLGHLQQASGTIQVQYGDRFSITHTIWCPVDTTIETNDIVTADSVDYKVEEVMVYEIGDNQHKQLLVNADYE